MDQERGKPRINIFDNIEELLIRSFWYYNK